MVSQTTSSKPTRLITFGCSLTYGHGLPDCFEPPLNPGPMPSNMGWPRMVADKKEMHLVNVSQCGISNRQIMHNILNFDFQKTDTVVILWTNIYRWCKILEDSIEDIGSWQNTPTSDAYVQHMSDEHDCLVSTSHYINLADYHLKNVGLNPTHIISLRKFYKDFKWNNAIMQDFDYRLRKNFPSALDNHHPGIEANREFAKLVLESIS